MGLIGAKARGPGGALVFGLALASLGGPLALSALFAPGVAGPAVSSVGLATLLGAALFCLPIAVWWRYSEEISSAGGLTAFVQAAAGRRLAVAQGAIWAVAYFLYMPYTVSYVAYDQLPAIFPGIAPYRFLLQLVLPLVAIGIVLAPLAGVAAALGLLGAAQLVLLLALGAVELRHVGAPLSSFAAHGGAHALTRATLGMSLLFVCGSLPLFLGEEVRGGGRTIRLAIAGAFCLAVPYVVFASFPLARVAQELRGEEIPGLSIAQAFAGRPFAVAVGLGVVASTLVLVLLEYLALTRLLHFATGLPLQRLTLAIGVQFVAADAIGLVDPEQFYEKTLLPSLGALWLSQLVVFAVYPLYRRRRERLTALDLALAVASSALVAWGFYLVVSGQVGGS